MIKLTKNIITFSIICIVTLVVIEVVLYHRSLPTDYYRKKYSEIYQTDRKHDLAIIGASHGFYGISPKRLDEHNFDSFNYCLDGSSPEFTYNWLKRVYLKNNTLPKIVVYEVNWFMFDDKWLKRKIEHDSIYLSDNDFFSFLKEKYIDHYLLVRNRLRVLKNENIPIQLITSNVKGISGVMYDQYYKGFIPHKSNTYIIDRKGEYKGVIDSRQVDFFDKTINLINENGSTLYLVQSPELITNYNQAHFANNDLIKSIAKKYNIEFLDYNRERISSINHSKYLFYDFGHLNVQGSSIFSARLAADLQNIIRH